MMVAVVHHQVRPGAPADEQDVVMQADSVRWALGRLGHQVSVSQCGLDLEEVRRKLHLLKPDVVFNLVESLAGTGRLIHLFPALLDAEGFRYTGSGFLQVLATSNKIVASGSFQPRGLPPLNGSAPFRLIFHRRAVRWKIQMTAPGMRTDGS